MTTTGTIQALFVGSVAGGGGGGSPILYDWETVPTSLTFTGDNYQVLAGVGIGGSSAGLLNGVSTATWDATLPGNYTTYDIWWYAPGGGTPTVVADARLNGVFVAHLVNTTLNADTWMEFAGTISPFNQIHVQFGATDATYIDNWSFS